MFRIIITSLILLINFLPVRAFLGFGAKNKKNDKKIQDIKLVDDLEEDAEELSDFEKERLKLQENEKKSIDFIFTSIDDKDLEASREEVYSENEKEQLLELWRATLARNRTIQFVIRVLSINPDDIEQNNSMMQVLTKAMFVPFYALSAVSRNSLISGGTAVGARVLGDVVDDVNSDRERADHITRTDLIVLFMLVDELAERLRTTYREYKDLIVAEKLINEELEIARIDANDALQLDETSSVFLSRMLLRDLERRLKFTIQAKRNTRRTLIDLAGEESLASVDKLIEIELKNY
jgi:hypothetical protein